MTFIYENRHNTNTLEIVGVAKSVNNLDNIDFLHKKDRRIREVDLNEWMLVEVKDEH